MSAKYLSDYTLEDTLELHSKRPNLEGVEYVDLQIFPDPLTR
jgi:hypothetical protein